MGGAFDRIGGDRFQIGAGFGAGFRVRSGSGSLMSSFASSVSSALPEQSSSSPEPSAPGAAMRGVRAVCAIVEHSRGQLRVKAT